MRAESGEVINVTFTRIVRESYEFGVDAQTVIDIVKEHAPEIAASYADRTVHEALYWLDGTAAGNMVLSALTKVDGVSTESTDEEFEDFENDAEDMAEYCADHDGSVDDHCDGCEECECECDDDEDEDEDEDEDSDD